MSQRKPHQTGKQSGTPTKVNHSPSHPSRSPLTASKFIPSSNSKPSVSYGELQIVLENIQQIRRKANLQITHLQSDNQRLREQLTRSQQDYEELSSRLNRSSNSKNDFEFKVLEQLEAVENDKRTLETELKQRIKIQTGLETQNKELGRSIQERDGRIRELEKQLIEWEGRWRKAFAVLAGDASRSEEIIWKVKSQGGDGIWGIIDQNTILTQKLQLLSAKMEMTERELGQVRQNIKQSTILLQKSMAEVTALNQKLSQIDQQQAQLRQKCLKTENELTCKAKDYQLAQTDYQKRISELEEKVADAKKQKQVEHHDLTEKVARLEEELAQKELQILEKQKNQQYSALISEVCEESQDFIQLLQRVRYLQKFRGQHYSNVEKIQFLCKMLDY